MVIAMTKSYVADRLRLGVCYYPEQWPEPLWESDMSRMREMGLSVIRVAEFAWSMMEPEEGRFEWDFWDRVLNLADLHDLRVILGTPTATPPAWLTSKYPEVLNATRDGVSMRHGQRRHYNYNALIYRELSERIASKMSERYASHPALFGWQIDNELNCEVNTFYSEADHSAFRVWLQAKYGTLDELNRAWGATFWNQTYSDWSQLSLTGPTPSGSPNPHQMLDEKRFISASAIAFAEIQTRAIRRFDQQHFITTNGLFGNLDSHELTNRALSFISYDSYPNFATIFPDAGSTPLMDRVNSKHLAATRAISPQFVVMEQQSGPGGWVDRFPQPSPKPGQIRLWTYQSIAHGADMVLYFRWRTASYGTEIYWHGINDYSNIPNRRCVEVAQVAREISNLDGLAGSRAFAEVAILSDYDNEWDGAFDIWHGPFTDKSAMAWFKALQHKHIPADILHLKRDTDLTPYRALIYPHPAILTEDAADQLKQFVADGGTVIFGCRTGYKDIDGHCPMRAMPGPVADLCGATVEEFSRLGTHDAPMVLSNGLHAIRFMEALLPTSAETLLTYGVGHCAGKPALVRNSWGKGYAYLYGSVFEEPICDWLIEHLGQLESASALGQLPSEVEYAMRIGRHGERFVFLLNYSDQNQPIRLHVGAVDLLTNERVHGCLELEPYGVRVLRL